MKKVKVLTKKQGRPKGLVEVKKVTLSLPVDIYDRAKRKSEYEGVRISTLVANFFKEFLKGNKNKGVLSDI